MKHLLLLFLVLSIVPLLWRYADKPTRKAILQRVKPLLKHVLIAAVAVYILLVGLYLIGSPKLL